MPTGMVEGATVATARTGVKEGEGWVTEGKEDWPENARVTLGQVVAIDGADTAVEGVVAVGELETFLQTV